MPDAQSILLLCAFLCFITGIFSPDIVIKWGLPSVTVRRRVLTAFSGIIVLLVLVNQLNMSLPKADLEDNERMQSRNVFLFSSIEEGEKMKLYKIADTGYTNHLSIEIVDEQSTKGNQFYEAPEGYEFVQVTYQITNQLDEPYTLDMNELQLQTETLETLSPMLEGEQKTRITIESKETKDLSLIYLQPVEEAYLTVTYLPLHYELEAEEGQPEEVVVSKIGEILKTEQAMIQVHEVSRIDQNTKVGYEYIEVSLSIKNPTNHFMTYYPFHFELRCNLSPSNIKPTIGLTEGQTLTITELASGGMVSGTLLFEVPKGASDLTLFYHEASLFTKQQFEINLMETANQPIPLQSEVILNKDQQEMTELEGFQLDILSTQLTEETEYSRAKGHQQFIMIEVNLTNTSSVAKEYTTYDFKLMNEQGRLLLPSMSLIDNKHELKNGTLNPNESVSGYLLFEDSDLYTDFTLFYSPSHWNNSNCLIQKLPKS